VACVALFLRVSCSSCRRHYVEMSALSTLTVTLMTMTLASHVVTLLHQDFLKWVVDRWFHSWCSHVLLYYHSSSVVVVMFTSLMVHFSKYLVSCSPSTRCSCIHCRNVKVIWLQWHNCKATAGHFTQYCVQLRYPSHCCHFVFMLICGTSCTDFELQCLCT